MRYSWDIGARRWIEGPLVEKRTAYMQLFIEPSFLGLGETGADEDSGPGVAKTPRIDAGINDRLVGVFHQNPTHGIHRVRLLEVHAKEGGVELLQIANFPNALWNFRVICAGEQKVSNGYISTVIGT
jgi:hypothetical protein